MGPKLHEVVVTLRRDGPRTQWGIRLVGGVDLDMPLIITKVAYGSPAHDELIRGDVIKKINEYDCRDIRHDDAQNLFKSAGNQIKVVVQRDNNIAYNNPSNASSRCTSTIPPVSPINARNALSPLPQFNTPYRCPSPLSYPPGPESFESVLAEPVNFLPHTSFPTLNGSGGYIPRPESCFSPMPTRDHLQEVEEETAAIVNQPYRTTPLILPGAKVKKDNCQTESYLRHHPNPEMRRGHHIDFVGQDVVMKQKVADSVLHRVVGDEASNGNKVNFTKQFNSPIGLYSDQNIENTIKQTVPCNDSLHRPLPTKIDGYKKTLVFDPLKSETYRALQEQGYPTGNYQELPVPAVQPKVFSPNRLIAGKKPSGAQAPHSPHQQQHPQQYHNVHAFGDQNEQIAQSGSFKRLMYSVLGDTTY